MVVIIISANLMAAILTYRIISSFENLPQLTTFIAPMHSYKREFKIKEVIYTRYVKQTFLTEKLTFGEMIQYYLLWCILATLVFSAIELKGIYWIVSCIGAYVLPIFIAENYIQKIDLSIDKGIFNLLTQINGRLIKSEDIIKALQETQAKVDNQYILKVLVEFNQYIKFGVAPSLAFIRIRSLIRNEYLRYLFLNIEIVYLRRGNVVELMKALENEYTSIQIEINKRKVELSHERKMTAVSLLMVVLTTLKIIRDNDYILNYYRHHSEIIFIVATFVLLGIGIIIKANITKY